ncbi:MAG: hypothetical protein ABI294_04320, partial [Casimicrobiaceae bacterium]
MTSDDVAVARGSPASPASRPAWQALGAHPRNTDHIHLCNLFAADDQRGRRYALDAAGLYLDYL